MANDSDDGSGVHREEGGRVVTYDIGRARGILKITECLPFSEHFAQAARDPSAGWPAALEALEAVSDRITTIADEAFGPFPVQSADDSCSEIEAGIDGLRRTIAELENRLTPSAIKATRGPATGDRCDRCHRTAPDANGCAMCAPERLGELLTEANGYLADERRLRRITEGCRESAEREVERLRAEVERYRHAAHVLSGSQGGGQ